MPRNCPVNFVKWSNEYRETEDRILLFTPPLPFPINLIFFSVCIVVSMSVLKLGALSQLQTISVEVLSSDDGEEVMKNKDGKMGVGSGYASSFMIVNPQSLQTDKTFTIGMNVDSSPTSTIQFFRSSDAANWKTWYKVDSEIDDGFATVKTDQGKQLNSTVLWYWLI